MANFRIFFLPMILIIFTTSIGLVSCKIDFANEEDIKEDKSNKDSEMVTTLDGRAIVTYDIPSAEINDEKEFKEQTSSAESVLKSSSREKINDESISIGLMMAILGLLLILLIMVISISIEISKCRTYVRIDQKQNSSLQGVDGPYISISNLNAIKENLEPEIKVTSPAETSTPRLIKITVIKI